MDFRAAVGQPVTIIFEVLDIASPPNLVTGQASLITKLLRDEDGAASETVTITEQGTSGFYEATFTPTKSRDIGFSYHLSLQCPVSGTDGARLTYEILVVPVLAVPAIVGPNLTTLANAKEYLGIKASDTSQDALVSNIVVRVSRLLEAWWGARIVAADYDEKRHGQGTQYLQLRDPINSITSLYQNLDQTWDSSSLIAPANYLWDSSTGIVYLKPGGFFLRGFRNVRAVYNAGYSAIPGEVEWMALEMINRTYRVRSSANFVSMSLKDGSFTRATATKYFGDLIQECSIRRRSAGII